MITDKHLHWEFPADGMNSSSATTRALPLGQVDLPDDITDLGPYGRLFVVAVAWAEAPAGTTIAIETSNQESGGTWTQVAISEATTEVKRKGQRIAALKLPKEVDNWIRIVKSSNIAMSIMAARDVAYPSPRSELTR